MPSLKHRDPFAVWWHERAREAGFELFCDLDTRMGHYVQTCVFPHVGTPSFAFPGDYVMQGTFNYGDGSDTTPIPQEVYT